eukprot:scaffold632_cov78-Phaeocystis_antarctica.AAC.3
MALRGTLTLNRLPLHTAAFTAAPALRRFERRPQAPRGSGPPLRPGLGRRTERAARASSPVPRSSA